MSCDMEIDIFAEHSFGKAALKKIAHENPDFRLYSAEWLGDKPCDFEVMKITGAVFRIATKGKNKGKRTVMVPGSKCVSYVTKEEMKKYD